MKTIHHFQTVLQTALQAGLVASLLVIGGCKDAAEKPVTAGATARATPEAVSLPAIATEAKGFTVGSAMSARTVYVFFDPQCPHCTALWEAARPLKSQAKFVWIPVGLLNGSSAPQGAALLAASDPAAAMDAHEVSMRERKGGIGASASAEAQKAAVETNTKLFNRFQFGSVPTIVSKHAGTGDLVVREGAMPTAALATALGLQVPTAN